MYNFLCRHPLTSRISIIETIMSTECGAFGLNSLMNCMHIMSRMSLDEFFNRGMVRCHIITQRVKNFGMPPGIKVQ